MREFIVEADGGSRGNPGPAGYGAVVIDAASGGTLVERAEYIGVATNNVAEYRGLLAGLRAARELDPTASVRVRMDSKLVVEQMSGRWKIRHPDLRPLALEAATVLPASQITYEWIPREQNKHADRLANEAMDAGRKGEQWSPSTSTAELEARSTSSVEPVSAAELEGRSAGRVVPVSAAELEGRSAGRVVPVSAAELEGRSPGRVVPVSAAELEGRSPGPSVPVSAADPETPATRPTAAAPTAERAPAPTAERAPAPTAERAPATPSSHPRAAKAEADLRAARNVAAAGPDLGAPATFVLLRHGETPLTPQKRFSGSGGSDPALSDVGRYQAERVADALAARGTIRAIVSSPLARCRETAGIVAARLGLPVGVEEGLRETDFGAWEGLTFGEVRERYPEDLNAWLASPGAAPTGGGESFEAVAGRVAATRDQLVGAYAGRTVLLVSHVTPIKTLVRLALGAPPESLFRMELSAASLSAVAYYADGNASLRLLNDTSHLR